MKSFFLAFFFCLVGISFGQNLDLFNKGNKLYNEGKYAEAISKYEQIIKNKETSAEVYFNIANAHYKLNNTAQSIYNYEKALQLQPNDPIIKQNLAFANNMKIDAIDVLPEIGYTKYFNTFSKVFKTDTWALITIVLVVLFVVSIIAYFFTYTTKQKRLYFVTSLTTLCLALFCYTLTSYKHNNIDSKRYAIVFSKESSVKTEPNFSSVDAFTLHEGTKVSVLDTINNWKQIKLSNGKIGWILNNDIKLLNKH